MTDLTRNVASNAAEIQVSAMDLTKTGVSKATEAVAEFPAHGSAAKEYALGSPLASFASFLWVPDG